MFVDTSAWIALVSAHDREHTLVDSAVQAAVATGIRLLTTNLVVAEAQRLILFRAGRAAARAFLEHLTRSRATAIHFVSRDNHRSALEWLDRLPDQELTYTDAVSFAVMISKRCKAALTLDKHFSVAGFARFQDLL
ncbi:MAG TPA: PIN domain-containing protein [Polyangiaceae bacterium]|nr:PIN domain-containing protein [Polyangiaceae bacterium]